ncbi:hypothetical protein Ciccas_005468 [Cichlidogyrus casuarinus]|uniref:VWFA domain-containing protein n=1 Tax=Cichlidogyrus casuarinus TaxID=1844966 RepID=A0ABD2Q8S3_9PLAT
MKFMAKNRPNDQFQFGVVTYATKADMVMSLKDFAGQPEAAARYVLSSIEYKPGQAGIGEGLKLIEMAGFDGESGARSTADKVVILIADSQANTETDASQVAYSLRANKVVVLAVGVGSEVSSKYLESLTHNEKMVIMSDGFQELQFAKDELMGMVCHSFRKDPVKELPKPCPPGQKLINSTCEIVGPTCNKTCPTNYILVYPCMCIVEVGKCPNACPKGKINNKQCECVLEHPPTCNIQTCPPNYTLNYDKCKCECQKVCNKNLFSLDPGACECVCNSKCRENFILNTEQCTCEKIQCGKGYILYRGKCRNDISKICPQGQLLFKDICLAQKKCPNGFVEQHGICKPECPNGLDDDGNCINTCQNGEYMLNGKCQKVTPMQCTGASHFAVPAPLCPRTCEEPIPLSRCNKTGQPEPGCVCDPGYFLLKGKCVRAGECPNKPLCLKKVDMLFMLDSSVSVGEPHFYLMKSLVSSIVSQFNTQGGEKQRVAVMAFNEKVYDTISFSNYRNMTHEDILKDILAIPYRPGDSFLGEAIHYARSQVFTMQNGMREEAPRMVMLLTRGNPSTGTLDAAWEARKLREAGTTLIVIGVGENIESKT